MLFVYFSVFDEDGARLQAASSGQYLLLIQLPRTYHAKEQHLLMDV